MDLPLPSMTLHEVDTFIFNLHLHLHSLPQAPYVSNKPPVQIVYLPEPPTWGVYHNKALPNWWQWWGPNKNHSQNCGSGRTPTKTPYRLVPAMEPQQEASYTEGKRERNRQTEEGKKERARERLLFETNVWFNIHG